MKQYNKPALSVSQQADLLIKRGLKDISKPELEKVLQNINYYRLRGYAYCYQDGNENFKPNSSWKYIYADYVNDAALRTLIFEAISYIEIGIRTQLEYRMSLAYGSRWYENPSLFHNQKNLSDDIKDLMGHWKRSRETFKAHYETQYDTSLTPPAWTVNSRKRICKITSSNCTAA